MGVNEKLAILLLQTEIPLYELGVSFYFGNNFGKLKHAAESISKSLSIRFSKFKSLPTSGLRDLRNDFKYGLLDLVIKKSNDSSFNSLTFDEEQNKINLFMEEIVSTYISIDRFQQFDLSEVNEKFKIS